ncbi:MAG: class I SAM-dependent methyltransferase [Acidobacteria bacterium]|nr:class I SAM-dependent methyltransferase [Acidobacteriota bacterium]
MTDRTREPQYQNCIDIQDSVGLTRLGLMSNQTWYDDPKRLVFVMSRYKFVSRLLSGMKNVLEVGCADAFGTRIVLQEVAHVTAIDFDPVFVRDVMDRMDDRWRFDCRVHDILDGPLDGAFDGVYALDLLEHIPHAQEDRLLRNMVASLSATGVLVIGTPSIQSQAHASPQSRAGHVNCKDGKGLRELLATCFHNVFIFSMNDEVVHTGFHPMAHYLFGVACSPRGSRPSP